MFSHQPRKIKFKAWNSQSRLLMRLDSIDCRKGELIQKDHTLLQYTGLQDVQENEIYDMDVLLMASEKYVVFWNPDYNGWFYAALKDPMVGQPFLTSIAIKMKRLCSYYELEK